MAEHTVADEVIDAQAGDTLIAWEVYVAGAVTAAVDEAVSVLGWTADALRAAFDAVVSAIGEGVAAALQVGQAIAAHAWQLTTGQRPRGPRRPARAAGGRRRPPRTRPQDQLDIPGQVDTVVTTGVRRIGQGEDSRTVIGQTRTSLKAVGTTAVNQAAATGGEQAAALLGAPGVVWVSERDACVHCLGLAGNVSTTGRFDGNTTFGDKPLNWDGFTGKPPRHPHCRCRVIAWAGQDDMVPAALQREAQRSIVRGWSLPTESYPARIRATQRLLRSGTVLPRSVERYGRDAVRAGRFPRGRTAPTNQNA